MRRWIFGLSAVVGTTALVLACSVGNDCDFGLCAGPTAGGDGGGEGGADGDSGPKPPAGCDPTMEPKDSPKCVSSDFGVFVSPNGKPDGTGKMDDPVNTITAALAKIGPLRRVYVCDGAYAEHVVLKSAISLYGGFKCDTWVHDDAIKPVVGKITESGYGLDVQSVSGAFDIFDLEFGAGNGDDAFPNSIAARFVGTSGAVLRRVKLTARDGAPGKTGDFGVAGSTVNHTDFTGTMSPFDPTGTPGTSAGPGPAKTCRCANAPATDTTAGASGGAAGTGGGGNGDPSTLPATGADDGAGGASSAGNCNVGGGGGGGHNGATRVQAGGGPVPTRLGSLADAAWKPEPGAEGVTALPGQGGGGGSGQSAGGGSGGGCGGCGGFGGKAGTGGGASIALLAVASPIQVAGELVSAKGGRGGDGGDGGAGGDGGFGGARTSGNGCPGGDGGKGGRGGAASGGAGGLSVGVLTSGAPPITDGATFTLGAFGDGGTGKSSNSGPPGIKANSASVENVSTKTTL